MHTGHDFVFKNLRHFKLFLQSNVESIITLILFICTLIFKGKNAPATVHGKTPKERLHNAWLKLQTDVNCYIDSDLDRVSTVKFPGIRQVRRLLIHQVMVSVLNPNCDQI